MKIIKILVTGGCGFIGTSLVAKLSKCNNYEITIIDNFSSSYLKNFKRSFLLIAGNKLNISKIKIIKGDITNTNLLLKNTKKIDCIIHLAASAGVDVSIKNPYYDFKNNVVGFINLIEAARLNKVKKIIIASSGASVGNAKPPINEKINPKPVSPYGASKLTNEIYSYAYSLSYNLNPIVLRFSNVYGPGSDFKQSVISKFIKDYMQKSINQIYGNGKQTRDFIYIDDLISAIEKCITNKKIFNEIFQISSAREVKISEINKIIVNELKLIGYKKLKTIYKPERKGDVFKNFSDNSKAKRMLNWKPKQNLIQGIKKTIKYFSILNNS